MALKVLVSGFENSGKTTLISKIQDSLIINCDNKKFNGNTPFTNYHKWEGVSKFSEFVNSKIKLYKEKFNKLPKYIIIDTISHLYTNMVRFNNRNYKGFDIHSRNNVDTIEINAYLEETILKNGIGVIIVAHCIVDTESNKFTISANGAFKNSGSWLSVVQESIFIERNKDNHLVHIKSNYLPARSLLEWDEDYYPINEFDINKYLDKLEKNQIENKKFEL